MSDLCRVDKVNILIVDDRPDNLTVLNAVLDCPEFNLIQATSGAEAIILASKFEIAVILLDVQMPDMDGFETALRIRQRHLSKDTPIIFVTAIYSDDEGIRRGYETGAVDYILKPLNPYILKSKVNVFVELFRKTKLLLKQSEIFRQKDLAQERLRSLEVERTAQREYIAEIKESEDRFRHLAECGTLLARSLDYESTIKMAVGLAVPRIADDCALHLFDKTGKMRTVLRADSADSIRGAFFASGDYQSRISKVVSTGLPEKVTNPDFKIPHPSIDVTCCVFVPLIARGIKLGVMTFLSEGRGYSHKDFIFIEELSRRVALAVDNSGLYHDTQEAVQTRDKFLSIASHELRTPLTPIKLQLQCLRKILSLPEGNNLNPEKLEKIFERTDFQINRLNNLIEDLLSVSRINLGHLKLELRPTDLSKIVGAVAEQFQDQLLSVGTDLKLNIQNAAIGLWDSFRIEQIVVNLLTNAIKYGSQSVIEITVCLQEEQALLIVADKGIGIAPHDQDRIFNLFERAAPSNHYGGLGLGLYIVKNIIAEHGGRISVESELDKGSRFIVRLPLSPTPTIAVESFRQKHELRESAH